MFKNEELIRLYMGGATEGKSNNMEIRGNVLVGYKHAVYANRINREVTVFSGWKGYSKTTANHLKLLFKYDVFVSNDNPSVVVY